MTEPLFKILQLDPGATHMLGWAKKEVRRILTNVDVLNRTWSFGDVTVRARAYDGVARLWLEAAPLVTGWAITKIEAPVIGRKLYLQFAADTSDAAHHIYSATVAYAADEILASAPGYYTYVVTALSEETGQAISWHVEQRYPMLQSQWATQYVCFSGSRLYVDLYEIDGGVGGSEPLRGFDTVSVAPEAFTGYVSEVAEPSPGFGVPTWEERMSAPSVVPGASAGFVLLLVVSVKVWTGTSTWYSATNQIVSSVTAPLPTTVGQSTTSTIEYVIYPSFWTVAGEVNDYENKIATHTKRTVQGAKTTTLLSLDDEGVPTYGYSYVQWVEGGISTTTKVYDDAWTAIGGWKYITEFAVQDLGAYSYVDGAFITHAIDVAAAQQFAEDKQAFRVRNAEMFYVEAKEKSDAVASQVATVSLPLSCVKAVREARPASIHAMLADTPTVEVTDGVPETVTEYWTHQSDAWRTITTSTARSVNISFSYIDAEGGTVQKEETVFGEKRDVATRHYAFSPWSGGHYVYSTTVEYVNWVNFSTQDDADAGSTGAAVGWVFVRDSYDTGIAEIWNGERTVSGGVDSTCELYYGTAALNVPYDPPLPFNGDHRLVTYPQILRDFRDTYKPKYDKNVTATLRPWQDSLFKQGEQVGVFLLSTLLQTRGDVGIFVPEEGDKVCYGWATYAYDYASGGFTRASYTNFAEPVQLSNLQKDYNCIVRFLGVGWKDVAEDFAAQAKRLAADPPPEPPEELSAEELAYKKLKTAVLDALKPPPATP